MRLFVCSTELQLAVEPSSQNKPQNVFSGTGVSQLSHTPKNFEIRRRIKKLHHKRLLRDRKLYSTRQY